MKGQSKVNVLFSKSYKFSIFITAKRTTFTFLMTRDTLSNADIKTTMISRSTNFYLEIIFRMKDHTDKAFNSQSKV
jgi:hypothetical protein